MGLKGGGEESDLARAARVGEAQGRIGPPALVAAGARP